MKNKKFWVSLLAGIMAAIMLLSLILSIIPHDHDEEDHSGHNHAQAYSIEYVHW